MKTTQQSTRAIKGAIKANKAIREQDARACLCWGAYDQIRNRGELMAELGVADLVIFGYMRGALTNRWDASTIRDASTRLDLQTILNVASTIDATMGINEIVDAWARELTAKAPV